jgi:hypothetical protein
MRMGTVDDHTLHGTVLKPEMELFVEHRVCWFEGLKGDGVEQVKGMVGYTKQD